MFYLFLRELAIGLILAGAALWLARRPSGGVGSGLAAVAACGLPLFFLGLATTGVLLDYGLAWQGRNAMRRLAALRGAEREYASKHGGRYVAPNRLPGGGVSILDLERTAGQEWSKVDGENARYVLGPNGGYTLTFTGTGRAWNGDEFETFELVAAPMTSAAWRMFCVDSDGTIRDMPYAATRSQAACSSTWPRAQVGRPWRSFMPPPE